MLVIIQSFMHLHVSIKSALTQYSFQRFFFQKLMKIMNVFQIAVLDVDICGPSIPKVMGIEGEQVRFAF